MESPLAVGAAVWLVMIGLRPATWTVTTVREQRELVLETTGPGFVIQTRYAVTDDDPAYACTVRLSQTITGPMTWAVALMVRRQVHILLRTHAQSLASPSASG